MSRAVQDSRTIITADLDYPRLLALTGAAGPSLILFRGGDWRGAEIVAAVQDLLNRVDEAGIAQSLFVVERDRVRRRQLPVRRN